MARDIRSLKGKVIKDDNSSDDDNYSKSGNSLEEFGLCLEKLNLGPKKKLLVLGFGGFLCFRVFRYDHANVPKSRRHDESYGDYLVYKRAHCEEFLKFCMERFEVAIWSSAKEYNLDKTLECIMKGLKRKLVFAWGQEKCSDTGFGSLEKQDKPMLLKELKKVWQNDNGLLPKYRGKFNPSNTLFIDSRPYKALLNPDNAIFPKEYKVDDAKDDVLGPNSELRNYLEKIMDTNDVPSFVKQNRIGQMAIAPRHPQWNYYSKVILKLKKT